MSRKHPLRVEMSSVLYGFVYDLEEIVHIDSFDPAPVCGRESGLEIQTIAHREDRRTLRVVFLNQSTGSRYPGYIFYMNQK
jgi:hypothetical protein